MARRPRFVWGVGPAPCDVAMFGEAPGKVENERRRPFVGKTGAVLDVSLHLAGLHREDIFISNVYKLWPGRDRHGNDLKPDDKAIKAHSTFLEDELERVNPRFIGTVGRIATRLFLGDVSMEAVHGIPHKVGDRVIVPIVHPAAGFRDPEMAVWSFQDIKTFADVVKGRLACYTKKYIRPKTAWIKARNAFTGGDGVARFANPAIDTEGDLVNPHCLSISTDGQTGLVVRASDAHAFAAVGTVKMHNAVWDIPILRKMGFPIDGCEIEDSMTKAYVLGTEPQALKDLIRRHLGIDTPEYADLVRPVYREELRKWVDRAVAVTWEDAGPSLRRDKSGQLKVYQPQPLNKRLARLKRDLDDSILKEQVEEEVKQAGTSTDLGKKIDLKKRIEALEDHLPTMETQIGPVPRLPDMLALLPEDVQAAYAGQDATATHIIHGILDAKLAALGLTEVAKMDCATIPMIERMMHNGIQCDTKRLNDIGSLAAAEMERITKEISHRWFGRYINLGSGEQVAELLYRKLHLRAPKFTSKGRGSTDKKSLEILRDQHECVTLIRQYRIHAKNKSFADTLPKFVQADGRIRGRIKYTRVISGRFSMEKPNMQQIPTRTEEGKEIRNAFVAGEGRMFGSWDYDQIEMKVMAHLSGDETLCGFINEGADIHIKTASLLFGVDEQDVTKVQRTVTKNINYGLLFMISAFGLYDQLRLVGIHEFSKDDCFRLIREWFRAYPKVEEFRHECIARARRKGYAQSMWGRVRWLPALYSPHDDLKAEAERQAVSHEISASAQDVLKRAMARLWQFRLKDMAGWYFEPILQIHDEMLFELDETLRWTGPIVSAIMCEDSSAFRVPITASGGFGKRWGEVK